MYTMMQVCRELDMTYQLPKKSGVFVPYLEMLQKDLLERDEEV